MTTIHTCPVCQGKGRVQFGFYNMGNINVVSSQNIFIALRNARKKLASISSLK